MSGTSDSFTDGNQGPKQLLGSGDGWRQVMTPAVPSGDTSASATGVGMAQARWVAAGDLDLAVMSAAGIWDLAPLIPLVNEAGGHCFDVDGATLNHWTGEVLFTGENTATALADLLAP